MTALRALDAEAVEALLTQGADPNAVASDGVLPLMALNEGVLPWWLIERLAQAGADLHRQEPTDDRGREGRRLMALAVMHGTPDLVRRLLEHGMMANQPGATVAGQVPWAPLALAVGRSGHRCEADILEMVEVLLAGGARADSLTLMRAAGAERPSERVIGRLMQAGADPHWVQTQWLAQERQDLLTRVHVALETTTLNAAMQGVEADGSFRPLHGAPTATVGVGGAGRRAGRARL